MLSSFLLFLRQKLPQLLADPTFRRRVFIITLGWLCLSYLNRAVRRPSAPLKLEAPSPVWLPFSEFLHLVEKGGVSKVVFGDGDVVAFAPVEAAPNATLHHYTRRVPSHLSPLLSELRAHSVGFEMAAPAPAKEAPLWQSLVLMLLPVAYVGGLCWVLFRFFGPDAGVGGSNAVGGEAGGQEPTRWEDVAGADEARERVREVCQVLLDPAKFAKAGARLPKGIMLVGPPGTGKTMLARAMASEAGLPFFYCSGSDFVEVFAGKGAARVRALFEKASRAAPAVIFIDEIDALGGARRSGGLVNNEEREQTLNQLLSCMDGFNSDRRVVVMAATNRFESLDKALVRPGRFDRVVRVELPDERGRERILLVHTRQMKLAKGLSLKKVAEKTAGFSGAELAALCNEAAINAVQDGHQELLLEDFLQALDRFAAHSAAGRPEDQNVGSALRELFQRQFQELD